MKQIQLVGSEKQIKWANDIRENLKLFIKNFEEIEKEKEEYNNKTKEMEKYGSKKVNYRNMLFVFAENVINRMKKEIESIEASTFFIEKYKELRPEFVLNNGWFNIDYFQFFYTAEEKQKIIEVENSLK